MTGLLDTLAGSSDPSTADPTTGLVDSQRKQLAYGILGQTGAALLAAGAPTMPGSGQQQAAFAQLGQIPNNVARQQAEMQQGNYINQRGQVEQQKVQQQKAMQAYASSPEFQKEIDALPPAMKAVATSKIKGGDIEGVLKTVKESRVQTAPINLGSGNVGFKQADGGYVVHNSNNMTTTKFSADGTPVAANYTGGAPVDPADAVPNEDGLMEGWLTKAVPQQYQNQVRQIGQGRAPLPSTTRGGINAQIASWANQYNPGLDATTFATRKKAATDYAPSGIVGKGIISLATLAQHANHLLGDATALDNGNYPDYNGIKNEYDYRTGGSKRTDFNRTRDLVTKELDTLVSGGHATLGETAQIRQNIDAANSPQQIQSAIDGMAKLAQDRLQSLTQQGQVALGKKGMQELSEQLHNPQALSAISNIAANPIKGSDRYKAMQAAKANQQGQSVTVGATPPQGQAAQPSAGDIAYLRSNPDKRALFERRFGAGSSSAVLGQLDG